MYQSFSCLKYGIERNFNRDCRKSTQDCFHCDQVGHIKAHCPLLILCEVQNPTHLAWQMPYVHHGRDEVPRMEGKAYQLVAEDPGAATM